MKGTIENIIKRDGSVVHYDRDRISTAIFRAMASIKRGDRARSEQLAEDVERARANVPKDSEVYVLLGLDADAPEGATALPVVAELWRGVRLLERELLPQAPEPEYYAYLTRELTQPAADAERQAYRLFGEVLAVYLDVLGAAGLMPDASMGGEVRRLSAVIAQTGDNPSPGSASGAAPPLS